jgi:hypothetical protein
MLDAIKFGTFQPREIRSTESITKNSENGLLLKPKRHGEQAGLKIEG